MQLGNCHGQIHERTFGSTFRTMVKKEIFRYSWKAAFCESAFFYVYSSHIGEAFFTSHNRETPSWMDPRRDIWDHIRAYGEIGNIVR